MNNSVSALMQIATARRSELQEKLYLLSIKHPDILTELFFPKDGSLVLTVLDLSKTIQVIKTVRDITNLPLSKAKDLVCRTRNLGLPTVILTASRDKLQAALHKIRMLDLGYTEFVIRD